MMNMPICFQEKYLRNTVWTLLLWHSPVFPDSSLNQLMIQTFGPRCVALLHHYYCFSEPHYKGVAASPFSLCFIFCCWLWPWKLSRKYISFRNETDITDFNLWWPRKFQTLCHQSQHETQTSNRKHKRHKRGDTNRIPGEDTGRDNRKTKHKTWTLRTNTKWTSTALKQRCQT